MSGVRDAHITNKHLKTVSSVGEHGAKDIGRDLVQTTSNKVEDFAYNCINCHGTFHFFSVHYCDTTRRRKYSEN